MKLAQADERKLLALLEELARAVEDLLLTGLTTASEATRQTLQVAFQEASRLRLLRLGSTLRVANDELGRFTRNETEFSRRRLMFFLNRAWLLSRGLARALRDKKEVEFERLLWSPPTMPVAKLQVVTLGVAKKITTAFVAFEFRFRVVGGDASSPPTPLPRRGEEGPVRLSWSCIFPIKPGAEIPAEGFLHLPQKQKFTANVFLERKIVAIEKAAVTFDSNGGGRLALEQGSTVTAGKDFTDWKPLLSWDSAAALERVRKHETGPFDLDIEMQEEIVLPEWEIGEPSERAEENQTVFPIAHGPVTFDAVVSQGKEGEALRKSLDAIRKLKKRPPLFGLMHYEKCRLLLQPLTALDKDRPGYLTIAPEQIDRATLLRALKF
ncbi:MAG: hypothetical protein HY040_26665 [Planctomycetes bacterium]|nr:hypothetical protein [Planctomycetota bacterium]